MLTDSVEIRIISKARQSNVRDHKRSRDHFARIFKDFLDYSEFAGKTFLDLGPGQFDFAVLARERGADAFGVDNDPAVLELGRYKGFEVKSYRLQYIQVSDFDRKFDGVFCKFSFNAFWFKHDPARHRNAVRQIGKLMTDGAWGWIAPWNGVPKGTHLSRRAIAEVLDVQAQTFKALGFEGFDLAVPLAKYYGVNGATANRALFIRNLHIPSRVAVCPRL